MKEKQLDIHFVNKIGITLSRELISILYKLLTEKCRHLTQKIKQNEGCKILDGVYALCG